MVTAVSLYNVTFIHGKCTWEKKSSYHGNFVFVFLCVANIFFTTCLIQFVLIDVKRFFFSIHIEPADNNFHVLFQLLNSCQMQKKFYVTKVVYNG